MNLYRELDKAQQARVNAYLGQYAFFAFNEKQFAEGMKKLDLRADDYGSLVRLGAGGFLLKDRAEGWRELAEEITRERAEAIRDPETGPQFAYDMFYYELANHEYSYTGDASETLEALGYDWEDVRKDSTLRDALKKACEQILQDARSDE